MISARRKRALTKRSAVNSIANVPSSSVIPRPGADPIPLFIGTEEPVNHKSSAVVVVVADKSGVKVTKRRNARTVSTVTGSSSVSQQSHDRHGRVLPLRRGKRWRRRSSRRHAHQPIHSSHSAGGSTTVYSNNDEDDDVISPYSDSRGHSRRQYSSRSADPRAVFIDSDVHDPDWSDDDVHTEYSYDSDEDSRRARRQSSRHTGNRSTQVLVRSVVRAPPRPSKLQLAVARYHRANQIQRSAGSELESDAQAREPRVRTVKSFARRMLSAGSRAGSGSFTGHTGDREQLLAIAEEDVYTRKAAKLDAQLVQSSTEAGDHTLLRLKVFDAVAKVIEDDISTAKAEIRKYKSRVARPA